MMGRSMTGHNSENAPPLDQKEAVHSLKNSGLYLKAANDVFLYAQRPEYSHLTVTASLFEIYGRKLFDLLNDRKLVKCLEVSERRERALWKKRVLVMIPAK